MANNVFGGELNIQGLEEGINRIEKKLQGLSTNFTKSSNKIISAFQDISSKGVQQLVGKLDELNTTLNKVSTNRNASLDSIGSGASRSVDEVTKLTNALNNLKTVSNLKLKTERAKRDYAKEANNIKEVVVQEKERTRELERQNKINIALNNKRLSVGKKSESNVIRQEMNLERQKERQLIEADAKDKARHKDRMVRLRQELKEIDRLAKAYKIAPTTISTKAAGGLIGQSLNATSINQRITAIHNLKNALKDLDTTTEKGKRTEERLTKELNRQTTELRKQGVNLDDVKNKKRSLMNTTDQLQRKLALLFSISSIQGYINTLVKIRGEFELQQRSLQILLQSKEDANELWDKTVKLAVKSPFTVKELVTYTKQLAAYRIESDKLYETNKMLADVSAGLGVDMQRLILAFGQVKAANFLRGTELRQFSEAGVNMLEELAKRFTELEGRAVSVGEVFDRISKRMVSFKDVEAVFKSITSRGGIFYQMQEKQAETLVGQLSNLRDVYQLMLNDVGKDQEGLIKGSIQGLMTLLKQWRLIAPAIQAALKVYITFLSLKGITKLINGVGILITNFRNLRKGIDATSKSLSKIGGKGGGILLLISLVAALGVAIYDTVNAIDKFKEEFNAIDRETIKDMNEAISKYRELADSIKNADKGSKELSDALEELKRHFDNILPNQMLQVDNIKEMEQGYVDAADAIRLFYSIQASERKKAKAEELLEQGIEGDLEEFTNAFSENIKGKAGKEIGVYRATKGNKLEYVEFSQKLADDISAGYINALNQTIESAKSGEIAATEERMMEEFYKNLSKFTGVDLQELYEMLYAGSLSFTHHMGDIAEEIAAYRENIGDMEKQAFPDETRAMQKQRLEYEAQKKTLDELTNTYTKLKNNYREYKDIIDKEGNGAKIDRNRKAKLEQEIADLYKELEVEIPLKPHFVSTKPIFDFSKMVSNERVLTDELNRVGQTAYNTFANNINPQVKEANTAIGVLAQNTANTNPIMYDFSYITGTTGENLESITEIDYSEFFQGFPKAATDMKEVSSASTQLAEDATKLSKALEPKQIQTYTNNVISYMSKTYGITENLFDKLRAGNEDSFTTMDTKVKDWGEALIERITAIKVFLANNPIEIDVSTYLPQFGTTSAEWEAFGGMDKSKMEEMIKTFRALFGGKEKDTKTKKQDTSAKDFAKVLEDMYKSYQDFNKKFDKGDASERVKKNWTEAFEAAKNKVKGFNLELKDFDFTSIEGLTAALEELEKTKQGKKISADIKKTLSGLTNKRDIDVEEKREELRDREIDQMFELYDIYKDLEKLGIDKKAAKGLFGIDATSLDEMRSKLEQMKAAGQFNGTDDEKAYQKYLDKITEMENKAQQERLKTYLKYSRDAMTDRAKIKFEELQKLAEIEKTFAIKEGDTDEVKEIKNTQRTSAIEAVQKESAQQTNKSLWEDFQKSDIFLSVFQDAENASVTMMEHVLAKLRGFKTEWANMPLESVKQITQKMTELENKLIEAQNPFKALREINKQIQDELTVTTTDESGKEVKTTISKEQLESDATAAQGTIDANNAEIDQLSTINGLIAEGSNLTMQQYAEYIKLTGQIKLSANSIDAAIKKRKEDNKNLQATVDKNNKVNNLQNQGKKALLKQADAIRQCNKMANDLYGAFAEIWEVAGGDEVTKMFADMGMSIATSVLDTIALQMQLTGATTEAEMFGKSMNSAMGIIGWIVLAVQIIAKVLSTAFAAHDKGLQEDIEKIDEEINVLQKSLEKLEEQLETVYSSTSLRSAMQKVNANIERQIALRREQIELEKDKKSEDEEQIKDWNDEIEELKEKQAELHKETVESLGGTYDIRSTAREFVDAWVEAFQETGDGLKGLKDNFKEFFKNILLEQAVMKGAGAILEPLIKEINKSLENDYEIDQYEAQKIDKLGDERMVALDDFLNKLLGENGLFKEYLTDGESSLSGLQEGIQGVTEETAQIIEAYLNSIRFYIAQDNQNLAKLTQMFTNEETENPMLSQLKIIATQTSAIRMVFDSVVRGGHSQGGFGVKVFID